MPNNEPSSSSSLPGAMATEDTPLLNEETGANPGTPAAGAAAVHDSNDSINNKNPDTETDDDDLDTPNQTVSRARGIAIAASVYVLIFLQACNMSGMTMAQSTIASDLDAYDSAMWFTSSYLIALSSLSPIAGRLASIFSPRIIVLGSSLFFSVGGLVTALARNFSVFILGRVITGIGGAAMMVLALILVLELTSKRRRGLFIGLVNAGFTTGVSLGAVVFGGLIGVTGWRFLFWIQTPAGLLAGIGVFFSLPASMKSGGGRPGSEDRSVREKLKRIDYLGALTLTVTLVLFLYSLSGQVQLIPLLVSVGALIIFVLVEYFIASDPIIPLSVLSNRGALLSCFAQLGLMAARWTVLFYAPITALAVRGFAPAASGSMLIPTNVGFGLGGLLAGALHIRRAGSFYLSCLISVLLFGASLLVLSFASSPDTPAWAYILVVFLNGLFTGGAVNYTMAHLLHLTLPETHYMATSLLGTFRGFAGSFGSAIGGGIFTRTLREGLEAGFGALDPSGEQDREQLIRKLVGSPALVFNGGLDPDERQVAVEGYVGALRVLFQGAVVLTVIVFVMQALAGWKAPQAKFRAEEEGSQREEQRYQDTPEEEEA